jgi:hypothetical protein
LVKRAFCIIVVVLLFLFVYSCKKSPTDPEREEIVYPSAPVSERGGTDDHGDVIIILPNSNISLQIFVKDSFGQSCAAVRIDAFAVGDECLILASDADSRYFPFIKEITLSPVANTQIKGANTNSIIITVPLKLQAISIAQSGYDVYEFGSSALSDIEKYGFSWDEGIYTKETIKKAIKAAVSIRGIIISFSVPVIPGIIISAAFIAGDPLIDKAINKFVDRYWDDTYDAYKFRHYYPHGSIGVPFPILVPIEPYLAETKQSVS